MKAKGWLRTERRDVRPFQDVSEILDRTELRIEKDGSFTKSTTIPVEDIDPGSIGIALKIPMLPSDVERKVELEREEISIVVIVNDYTLKKSDCIHRIKLDEINEDPYELNDKQLKSYNWKGNVSIDVAAVLSVDRSIEPNKPFLAGHWIAKKRFSLNAGKENPAFPIISLSGDGFKERGLPVDTVYYVDFVSDSLDVSFTELENAFKIYIHEDVFNSLVRNENSPQTRLAERILMTEIFACILAKYINTIDDSDLLEDGVLKSLLDRIVGSTDYKIDKLKEYANKPGYPELRSIIQSYLSLKKTFERGGI